MREGEREREYVMGMREGGCAFSSIFPFPLRVLDWESTNDRKERKGRKEESELICCPDLKRLLLSADSTNQTVQSPYVISGIGLSLSLSLCLLQTLSLSVCLSERLSLSLSIWLNNY